MNGAKMWISGGHVSDVGLVYHAAWLKDKGLLSQQAISMAHMVI
jgi:alkylation response protein AidB-like acyl-CoA dehydrogenase